jgi:hypothetical protein
MTKLNLRSVLAGIAALSLACGVLASDSTGLILYKNSDGLLSQNSRDRASQMTTIAAKNGEIALWITLNYEINLYLDQQLHKDQIAQQNDEIRSGLESVLSPLIARGQIRYPKGEPYIVGPGCAVWASPAGLRALIADARVLQIVAVE